jgi:hypothetical protein
MDPVPVLTSVRTGMTSSSSLELRSSMALTIWSMAVVGVAVGFSDARGETDFVAVETDCAGRQLMPGV